MGNNDYTVIDLHTFNDEMTISQVVRFFERNGYEFTKTMIQNYIRIGVLPPPLNKRYYTKNHLMLLSLIYRLKSVFSLDEIKEVFMPILNQNRPFENDIINTETLYKAYESFQVKALESIEEYLSQELALITKTNNTHAFMIVLKLMAKITTMKQLLDQVIKEHLTDKE